MPIKNKLILKVSDKVYKFEIKSQVHAALRAVNPFLNRIPQVLMDNFEKSIFTLFVKTL